MRIYRPRNSEVDADSTTITAGTRIDLPQNERKNMSNHSKKKPKTPQNKLSVGLWVLSCAFLGVEPETDILSYVIFVTGNTEHMRQFINYLQRW